MYDSAPNVSRTLTHFRAPETKETTDESAAATETEIAGETETAAAQDPLTTDRAVIMR